MYAKEEVATWNWKNVKKFSHHFATSIRCENSLGSSHFPPFHRGKRARLSCIIDENTFLLSNSVHTLSGFF